MNTYRWVYALGVVLLAFGLPIFSYLTLIYRELGRMTTGRVREHLDIFETEIEPKLRINRRSGGRTRGHRRPHHGQGRRLGPSDYAASRWSPSIGSRPVSSTHLTLPTIVSV